MMLYGFPSINCNQPHSIELRDSELKAHIRKFIKTGVPKHHTGGGGAMQLPCVHCYQAMALIYIIRIQSLYNCFRSSSYADIQRKVDKSWEDCMVQRRDLGIPILEKDNTQKTKSKHHSNFHG